MLRLIFPLLILLFYSPSPLADDYTAYSQSPFSNPAFDPLVKEGFEAMDREDTATAIEFLRKGVTAGASSPLVFFKLALAYETQGSYYSAVQYYDLAREGFKKANQDHPYFRQFPENYGRALYMLGQTDKALPVLEEAASNTLGSPWVCRLLGQIFLSKKQAGKAADYFARFAAKEPNITKKELIDIDLGLARAFRGAGDEENTAKYYGKVAALDPSNQEAGQYLRNKNSSRSMDKLFEIFKN